MQRYRLREELIDLAHTANSKVLWNPVVNSPSVKSHKPTSPARTSLGSDLIPVEKPKFAYTIGVRRVSVFNPNKAALSKPIEKAADKPEGTPESESGETTGSESEETAGSESDKTTTIESDEREGAPVGEHMVQCSISHIPLGSARRGKVVHSDKVTGEDGKVVPCLLYTVEYVVEERMVNGERYFFPTKVFTPSNKMVKKFGGEVIPGVPNIYGDAPCDANWTHEDEDKLPRDIVLYYDRGCFSGCRFPYREVMGEVSTTQSAFNYDDFVTEDQTEPDFKFTSRLFQRSSSPAVDSAPGVNKGRSPVYPPRQHPTTSPLRDTYPAIHIRSEGICHSVVEGPARGRYSPQNITCTCGFRRASLAPPDSPPRSRGGSTTFTTQQTSRAAAQASTDFLTPQDSPGSAARKKRKAQAFESGVDESEAKRQKVGEEAESSEFSASAFCSGRSTGTSVGKKRKHEAVDGEVQKPVAKFPRIRLIVNSRRAVDSNPTPMATSAQPNPEATTTQQVSNGGTRLPRIRIKFRRDDQDKEIKPHRLPSLLIRRRGLGGSGLTKQNE
ncbi:uncharacterized protein DFL_001349 [Arthrobotrys flagrans]|uniref:Uncharacterized protein n=1 Tax=Arthrobotrys flagrans TaxID=97331 RepID=A0A437AGU4_ARTFL|nr:hypothetical protein DFL_001349 [Arthrobotrys flagrans]